MQPQFLVPLDAEDHPEKAATTRSKWIQEEKHGNFQGGDPAGHVILETYSHKVHYVKQGGSIVNKEDYQCFFKESPDKEIECELPWGNQ